MQKTRIGLSGSSGRMGQAVAQIVQSQKNAVVQNSFRQGQKLNQWNAGEIDVVIDFSSPQALTEISKWCVENKKPLISGTTGLSPDEHESLKSAGKQIAVLWSPNMSLGIACIRNWLKNLNPSIKKWDMQIEETHHRHKKDAPSGTALFLNQTLKDQGIKAPQPLSIRGGGAHGSHKVLLMGEGEIISIEHIANNRDIFAKGALQAALWILNQKPGFYHIQDCL